MVVIVLDIVGRLTAWNSESSPKLRGFRATVPSRPTYANFMDRAELRRSAATLRALTSMFRSLIKSSLLHECPLQRQGLTRLGEAGEKSKWDHLGFLEKDRQGRGL